MPSERHYTEYRVYYSYGVNSGTLLGRDVESMIHRHETETMGPVNVDKVEARLVIIQETEWETVPYVRNR